MSIEFTLGMANWLAYEKIGQPFSEANTEQLSIFLRDLFSEYLSLENDHHWLILIYYARILEKLSQRLKVKEILEGDVESSKEEKETSKTDKNSDEDEEISPLSKEAVEWWAFIIACNFACKYGLDEDADNRSNKSEEEDFEPDSYGLDALADLLPQLDPEMLSDFEDFFFDLLEGNLWVTFNQTEFQKTVKEIGIIAVFFDSQSIEGDRLHPWEIHTKPTPEMTIQFNASRSKAIETIEAAASTPAASAKKTIFPVS